MAGVAGFEPTNDDTKNRCLTTWRHPNFDNEAIYILYFFILQELFYFFLNFLLFKINIV